jgi:hypothetical protein
VLVDFEKGAIPARLGIGALIKKKAVLRNLQAVRAKKQGLCFLTKALFKFLSVGLKDHLPPNDPGNLK